MGMPETNYRVIGLVTEEGDLYTIVRDSDSGGSVVLKNLIEKERVKALGLTDLVTGAYAKMARVDESDIEGSESVDPTYSGVPVISEDTDWDDLPDAGGRTVIFTSEFSTEKYSVPKVKKLFSYDVNSVSFNQVLDDLRERFSNDAYRELNMSVDRMVDKSYPSLERGRKPRLNTTPRAPDGSLPPREVVRTARAAEAPGEVIAKSRIVRLGTREGAARWQKFWKEMENIEDRGQ